MKAYAGGGSDVWETAQVTEHDTDAAHEMFHDIGGIIGYWPLLIIILTALGIVFRKKVKAWILK